MDQQNEERKVHYIDVGDSSIEEDYIKMGRPDLVLCIEENSIFVTF